MRQFITAALFLGLSAPALAAPGPVRTIDYDGTAITYSAETQADGSVVVTGARADSSKPFKLRIRNGWVAGSMDGQPVAFRAPRAKPVRAAAD